MASNLTTNEFEPYVRFSKRRLWHYAFSLQVGQVRIMCGKTKHMDECTFIPDEPKFKDTCINCWNTLIHKEAEEKDKETPIEQDHG